jgi:hypothetical protein
MVWIDPRPPSLREKGLPEPMSQSEPLSLRTSSSEHAGEAKVNSHTRAVFLCAALDGPPAEQSSAGEQHPWN